MAFADIPVSTQTFTVRSNIQHIELHRFYEELEPQAPTELCPVRSVQPMDPGSPSGGVGGTGGARQEAAIICIKYQQHKKGCDPEKDLKTKRKRTTSKEQESPKRNFLNCITLIIQIEKRINIKIFKNGVFQLTGCKDIDNVRRCLKLILTELSKANERIGATQGSPTCFQFEEGSDDFVIYIKSAMRNIDFDLGFKVNRSLLAKWLTRIYEEDDDVIIPDAIGNKMDVKVKLRIAREELEHLPVTKITNPTHAKPKEEEVLYKNCLHIIEPDKKKLETKLKDKFVSISVFQNGKVLLSAMDASIQEKYYEWFTNLISEIEEVIKPTVLPKKTFLVGKSRQKTKLVI
jgi:TATA-box binding protein (TBP) (component of TFIID and TFIIIB)